MSGGLTRVETSRRVQSIIVTAARVLAAVLVMGIPIVLVRVLDQTTFGHYKQLFLVAQTVTGLLSLGLTATLYYFVPRSPERSQQFMVQTAGLLFGLGLCGAVLLWTAREPIAAYFDAPLAGYLPLVALFAAVSIVSPMFRAAPMVDRRARLAAFAEVGADLLRGLAIVIVALLTRDLFWVLVAACAAVAANAGGLIAYLGWRGRGRPWKPSAALLAEQLAYALPFAGTAILALSRNQLHAYYVAGNFSAAEFAIYAVATLNIPLIGFLTQTVGEVVILENAKNFKEQRLDEMRRVWRRATYSLGLVMLPVFAAGQVFAGEIMVVLFTPEYAAAAPVFRIYMLLLPLTMVLASPVLRAIGDVKRMFVFDLVSLLVNLAALVLLTPLWGPLGAVGSLVLARAAFVLLAARRAAWRTGLHPLRILPWGAWASMLALSLGGFALAHLALGGAHAAWRLFAGGAAGVVVYLAVAWWSGLVPDSEKALAHGAWRRLRGRVVPANG